MGNKPTYFVIKAGILVSLFLICTLYACGEKKTEWAKVGSIALFETDALLLMQYHGYDANLEADRKKFTEEWIDRQVCIQELAKVNPTKLEILAEQTKWHLGDLSRYYLEESFIQQQVQSKISDSLIIDYFEKHKAEFSLNDYIVRALYIKVPKEAPNQDKLRQYYLLKKDKDYSKVISYAKLYADNFYFDDSTWVYFDELTKGTPTEQLNKDNLVLNRTKTYFSDESFNYYLNIIDFKLKDATPPMEFLKPLIEQLIIAQKLNELKGKNSASFIHKLKQNHEITSKY